MFWYIALFIWAVTIVNAYASHCQKLAMFTLVTGIAIIIGVYFFSLGFIGQPLLCAVALISFFGEKFSSLKSK